MPIKPNEEETKVDFIDRCMNDEGTIKEYADDDERQEYCTLQFNEANPQEEVEEALTEEAPENAIATPDEGESKEDFIKRCVTDEYDNEACELSWEENQPEEEEKEEEKEEMVVDTKDLYIYDMIGSGGVTAKGIVSDLEKAGKNTNINLRINSAGGDVFEGIAIYNSLKKHNGNINVEIEGLAASMASIIMLAGDNITASENSLIMVHNPSIGIQGESKDLTKKAELLDKIKDQMVGIYTAKTGMNEKDVIQMMDSETWLTAEEALQVGLITNVGESIKVAAVSKTEIFNNAPEWVMEFKSKQNPSIMGDVLEILVSLKNKITGFKKEKEEEGVRILDNEAIKDEIVNLSHKVSEANSINEELLDALSVVATQESEILNLKNELEKSTIEINKLNATPTKVMPSKDPSVITKNGEVSENGWDIASDFFKNDSAILNNNKK
jgi:ATP-dependent Clp endopeptidase proteolytic subunit ClpP